MPDTTPDENPAAGEGGVRRIPLSSLPDPTRALPVLSAEQTAGLCPLQWNPVSVPDDGRHIVVTVKAGAQAVKGVQIREARDEVILTVYGLAPLSTVTTAVLRHTVTVVELPEALGGRRLVARPTGDGAG